MRATDSLGNRTESRGDWPQFRGPVDTKFPAFDVDASYSGSGSAAQTTYSAAVRDFNLTTDNYDFVCPLAADQLRYDTDPVEFKFTQQQSDKLSRIDAQCVPCPASRAAWSRPAPATRSVTAAPPSRRSPWPTSAPTRTVSNPSAACPTPSSAPT